MPNNAIIRGFSKPGSFVGWVVSADKPKPVQAEADWANDRVRQRGDDAAKTGQPTQAQRFAAWRHGPDIGSAQAHRRRFTLLTCGPIPSDATCSRHAGPLEPPYNDGLSPTPNTRPDPGEAFPPGRQIARNLDSERRSRCQTGRTRRSPGARATPPKLENAGLRPSHTRQAWQATSAAGCR